MPRKNLRKEFIKELNKLIIGKKGREYNVTEIIKMVKKNNQKIKMLKEKYAKQSERTIRKI